MTNLLTSCADGLNYSLNAIFSSNSIIDSSEEAVATSNPFSPNLSLNGEAEYESVLWTKHSGPSDIIFSDPTILNPEISATKSR